MTDRKTVLLIPTSESFSLMKFPVDPKQPAVYYQNTDIIIDGRKLLEGNYSLFGQPCIESTLHSFDTVTSSLHPDVVSATEQRKSYLLFDHCTIEIWLPDTDKIHIEPNGMYDQAHVFVKPQLRTYEARISDTEGNQYRVIKITPYTYIADLSVLAMKQAMAPSVRSYLMKSFHNINQPSFHIIHFKETFSDSLC